MEKTFSLEEYLKREIEKDKKTLDIFNSLTDEDFQKILFEKIIFKLGQFQRNLKLFGYTADMEGNPIRWDDKEFWVPYLKYIIKHVILVRLHDEFKRYRKKNRKSDYLSDIEKARSGSKKSLINIVTWDKAWLFIDWIKQRILQAEENGDFDFLKEIGDATGKTPGTKKALHNDEEKNRRLILSYIETSVVYLKVGLPTDSSNPILKVIYDSLIEKAAETLPEVFFYDYDYFMKFLRRHAMIR